MKTMKRIYSILIAIAVFQGCEYSPDYTTSQGVDVFENCTVCPDRAEVEHALEYYKMRAPDVLGWNNVGHHFKRMRLFIEDKPVDHGCWQSDTCGGTVFPTGIGADVFLWVERCVAESDLHVEITKYFQFLDTGKFDYEYADRDTWNQASIIINEYMEIAACHLTQ